MNKQILQNLIDLNVYTSKSISKQEYQEATQNGNDARYIYSENVTTEGHKWFEQIDTKKLTHEEIELLLKSEQIKNSRSIKHMMTFFTVLTVISLIISLISAVRVASLF